MKRPGLLMIIVSAIIFSATGALWASDDSYVFGRLTGTYQDLPGYFHNHIHMLEKGIREVEFTGFRLVRIEDGKRFFIRPDHRGFFNQNLPGGYYTLARKRTDRPGYREAKNIDIMNFKVRPGALVNLGTIHIILDGEPQESLRPYRNSTKGIYIYRYRYERKPGDDSYEKTYNWFKKKKRLVAAEYGKFMVREDAVPTLKTDGSKKVLKLVVPWEDR